ncbi:MAG: tyrosine-type recombinase/integrase [Candidatus Desulfaltia sp.]|nr:tyrosine-type recombinase/integrase [Candidatus Desulfaltia sp.]
MNLQDAIKSYMEYLEYEQLASSNTIPVRLADLNKYHRYMGQGKKIEDIREIETHHLRSYISHLRTEEGYQPISICNIISGLRAFYSFSVKRGIVAKNLAEKIKKPRVEQKEIEHFTWEEVEKIFLSLPRDPNYLRNICILLLFYYSGVRLDELRYIEVSDLSADFSEMYVEKAKGDKSRLLPVHPFVQRVLKLYLRQAQNSSYLFPGKEEKPLSKSRVYKIVKNCGETAGIKKRVSPHTFRHSFATHLHQKGVDINRLALLLGHANIEKTATYTHTEDDELIEAVQKL